MHLAVPKHEVLVIILKKILSMFLFYRMNTSTKLLRIGTQQYSPPQIIILDFKSQLQIY